ncbi:Anthranilate N-benzoyltransferase protein 3-like protein [Mycena venus]|uniref:Anthranilate N-benzoyltransferase protein 3-like protein n=1 Tax=Mycena venus TaxID=2733690 RepID=A0A8H7CWY2_9AGAR|nr:Anthranilate N-benzoyltransferase protein 3-like protein [Mycena venus]
MTTVTVTSQHTVRGANETSWTTLDDPFRLGPFDHLVPPFIPITAVFVYEKPPAPTPDAELIPIDRFQRALSLLLEYYPHLTGRLQFNSSDGTPEITRPGTGAAFLVAQCSERLATFSSEGRRVLMENLPGAGNALIPPFDPSPEGLCRDSFFTIQHTRFACGSVALGVRLHHMVCDADGFLQLVRDLAELYRGLQGSITDTPSLVHPPHIRSYLWELSGGNMTAEQQQAALDYKPLLHRIEPIADNKVTGAAAGMPSSPPGPAVPPARVIGRSVRFSSRELETLKAQATDPHGSPDDFISTFDALTAHLYQRVYRARLQLRTNDPSLGELSPPDFLTPVNVRSRLGLPARYFPNSLCTVHTSLPPDVLVSAPLWQVAKAVHDLTRIAPAAGKEETGRMLRWIAAQPDKRQIRSRFRYGSGSLTLSQWNKFDMYTTTVFDGPPVFVGLPFTAITLLDGLGFLLPTEERAGGDAGAIDVNLSLTEPVWEIFDRDEPIA